MQGSAAGGVSANGWAKRAASLGLTARGCCRRKADHSVRAQGGILIVVRHWLAGCFDGQGHQATRLCCASLVRCEGGNHGWAAPKAAGSSGGGSGGGRGRRLESPTTGAAPGRRNAQCCRTDDRRNRSEPALRREPARREIARGRNGASDCHCLTRGCAAADGPSSGGLAAAAGRRLSIGRNAGAMDPSASALQTLSLQEVRGVIRSTTGWGACNESTELTHDQINVLAGAEGLLLPTPADGCDAGTVSPTAHSGQDVDGMRGAPINTAWSRQFAGSSQASGCCGWSCLCPAPRKHSLANITVMPPPQPLPHIAGAW